MRKWIKKLSYLLISIGIGSANAGSYEDFFSAITRDDAATVVDLIRRGFDPNAPNPDGLQGLFLALRGDSLAVADALITWPRTEINAKTAQDESPLMMASLRGQMDQVRMLIARGADINKTGWAPLHYAATNGHVQIMELLLEHHAYIDAESPNGTTPLMMAAKYGTPGAVKLLLEAGADPTLKNQLGLNAQDFARQGNRPDALALIDAFSRARGGSGS